MGKNNRLHEQTTIQQNYKGNLYKLIEFIFNAIFFLEISNLPHFD